MDLSDKLTKMYMYILVNTGMHLDGGLLEEMGGSWRGEGGGAPLPFFKNQKKCPDFEKKAWIVSIFVLNFPFKM